MSKIRNLLIVLIFAIFIGLIWFYQLQPSGNENPSIDNQNTIIEERGILRYSVGGCVEKREEEYRETANNENIKSSAVGNTIRLNHQFTYVCCGEIKLGLELMERKVGYTLIKLKEKNVGKMCRCICNYTLNATLGPLSNGEYVIQLFGIEYDKQPAKLILEEDITIK